MTKHYGIATKDCIYNLKCNQDLVPFIFTEYKMAKDACDKDEEVVELYFTSRKVKVENEK